MFKNFSYLPKIIVHFRGSCIYVNLILMYMSYKKIHFTDCIIMLYRDIITQKIICVEKNIEINQFKKTCLVLV